MKTILTFVIGAIGGGAVVGKADDTMDAVGDAADKVSQVLILGGLAYMAYRITAK